ncbi:DsbA family protein [Enterobacteriaceae bacterium H11S18]|uniref:DsbA family protein n=1 Tax=Dryocola clanedunensis TaxID=2925396 RepID=UPI0022F0D5D6|nr:DsbA family protein [Dryocola clanedunensis]MCT4706704.1 DsbA family protein [Dryocola clanedunensis]MCT4712231.1 DsbA family protein [Dryocola clanedunensis]
MKLMMTFLLMLMVTFSAQAAETSPQPPNKEEEMQKLIYEALFHDPQSPVIGAKNPTLTLVAFTDYNCPYCKQLDPMLEKITRLYPQVAVVIKPLPFKGESSNEAAGVVLTTWREHPDEFLKLHQLLMSKKGYHTSASIKTAIEKSGATPVTPDQKSMETISLNLQLARVVGVQGTPATIVGDTMLAGAVPWETLEGLVKEKLEQANGK